MDPFRPGDESHLFEPWSLLLRLRASLKSGSVPRSNIIKDNGRCSPHATPMNRARPLLLVMLASAWLGADAAIAAPKQDKPMMTIDSAPGSPTFGRLYVVWNEPAAGGAFNLVISQCDTRSGPISNPANCDNADNWTPPVSVTQSPGSYIYGDVAVGPDGKAYVTWWDYSSTNAIRGAICDPAAETCSTSAAWAGPTTIASLDATGGAPVPFACPIVAQPGGRAAPSPQVEVDHWRAAERAGVRDLGRSPLW